MVIGMRVWTLLAVFVGAVHCNTFDYEYHHDTCNSVSEYMVRKDPSYAQKFSKEPDTKLTICGSGPTCCSTAIEDMFKSDVNMTTMRVSYFKDGYIPRLTKGRENIDEYITQVLTMGAESNKRTKALVDGFLKLSNDGIQSIDPMQYPVAVLLDIAESHAVDTLLLNSSSCIAEMSDFLVPLVELQVAGLMLARLLYQAIPEGEKVLQLMRYQDIPPDCLTHLTKSQRCNSCLDSTNVRPCRGYCLAITEKCYSHLKSVSQSWEEYARLIGVAMDRIDYFAKVYQAGLGRAIQAIVVKLRDPDIADMCGYSLTKSLEVRHKRDAPQSKTRNAIFNGSFMVGMLGNLDGLHCGRYSTVNEKCWNGTDVGLFTGNSNDIQITNDLTVTNELTDALKSIEEFNKEFGKIESIEIKEPQYNIVGVTEEPEFSISSDLPTALLSIGLLLVSLLLH